jgi:hypothetical protein
MPFNSDNAHDRLHQFKLQELFVQDLGWSNPTKASSDPIAIEGVTYQRSQIAQMSGVPIFEITAPDGEIPTAEIRSAIYQEIAHQFAENLLIFVDGSRTRSLWYWAKREGTKYYPRTESYVQGQPPDLLLSKIGGLYIPLEALESGEPPVIDIASRLQQSFDVEKVTKKFYQEFQAQHQIFLQQIEGIESESDRRWYASVLLNRLMFVYFLQKKYFIDNGDLFYLKKKLEDSQRQGNDRFYADFLQTLFFEGFAKPDRNPDRPDAVVAKIGQIPYLNGGLFLQHPLEQNPHYQITIPDAAFEQVFNVFEKYSWHLDDTPGGKANEINPDVLGYIFEKYINQKAFGAYYTRTEITEYLCDRTINKLILDRVNRISTRQFDSIGDLLVKLDANLCRQLIYDDQAILRTLSLLDPACGSGAFLIAAMKTLIPIYSGIIGVIKTSSDRALTQWLQQVERNHPSLPYFIKKQIISDNLYGVDIMEEAMEIAKLRLFLALVSSAQTEQDLEPLPNIDFNIMAGNSLIGLMRVDESGFDAIAESGNVQMSLLGSIAAQSYEKILEEKNANIDLYKKHAFLPEDGGGTEQSDRLQTLRNEIDKINRESEAKLNQLLLDEFSTKLGIKYEQAQRTGKAKKRLLTLKDIADLKPFHWGYHFDRVMARGGFDAIIANPPWEVFKPNAKEFFTDHSDLVSKKKMDIKAFEKEQKKLLQDPEIAEVWAHYQSQFPHISLYYRSSDQFKNQISIVNGKKAGTDINFYKLFLEQCFNLLRSGGECGIVIPSGIYTDLGAKQLREMLFSQTQITTLYGLSNEKFIFENVHHSFKIAFLTFEKGRETEVFSGAFRINPREAIRPENLDTFLNDKSECIEISVPLIRQLSPDSLSVMEFKSHIDIVIAQKMLKFPLLGEKLPDTWNLQLTAEFHMTNDSHLFKQEPGEGRLPLYEGKMIHQFTHKYAEPRYWVDEAAGRKAVLGRNEDTGQVLNYQSYRLGFRDVASSTNERSMISGVIPPNSFAGNTLIVSKPGLVSTELLLVASVLNSFSCDFIIRQKISQHCNIFYVNQLPIPRLVEGDRYFKEIVDRAAKLICTTPEFDDLAAEVGLRPSSPHPPSPRGEGGEEAGEDLPAPLSQLGRGAGGEGIYGVTDESDRAQLRAELDGMIAHLYGLTEAEFAHILSTFPIVADEVKQAALESYRNFTPKAGDAEILAAIAQGESAQLEFKSTARWNLKDAKKDKTMEEVILKTVAAFLNTHGGTLLIGVADNGEIVGLQPDYQTLQKQNADGFELWLINDLLLKEMGKQFAAFLSVSFHAIEQHEICKITAQPAPNPVYIKIRNKAGQPEEGFYIRTGNSTNKLDTPSAIASYTKNH